MQIIRKKYKKNILNILLSSMFISGFCYVILAADKYTVDYKTNGVNAAFLEIKDKDNKDGYISLDNMIIFNQSEDGNFTYIVQPGDTLLGVASKFGTTIATLKKVNSLQRNYLKQGERLIITQQDGVIYELTNAVSISDFAQKYNLNLSDLMELNYIDDKNYVFQKDEEIFVPITEDEAKKLGLVNEQPKPIEQPAPKVISKTPTKTPTKAVKTPVAKTSNVFTRDTGDNSSSDTTVGRWYYNPNVQNGFARGYCTRYVAIKKFPYISQTQQQRIWGGNARNWYSNAKSAGYSVGHSARAGAIVVMSNGGSRHSSYGHVGIVKSVDLKNNKILIEDMNAAGKFIVTTRWISMDRRIVGYIYM